MTNKKTIENLQFLLNSTEDKEAEETFRNAIKALNKIDRITKAYINSNVKFMIMAEMASQFEEQIVRILEDKE